jgi:hypothetical protein
MMADMLAGATVDVAQLRSMVAMQQQTTAFLTTIV